MTDPNQPANYRLRLIFAKKEQVKYISHLDLALTWERALRRAKIPLAYSQGFNPRPKIQVASGLPLGTTGRAEILDIIVTQSIDPTDALDRINPTLPVGIALHAVEEVPLKSPTLQNLLREAEYEVVVETDLSSETIRTRIDELMTAERIIQTRIRKKREEKFDLRPWLHDLSLVSLIDRDALIRMRLTTGQHGNLRPEQVIKALDLADNWHSIERTKLIFAAVDYPS